MQIKSSNINIQKFQKRNIDKEYLYFLNYKNSFEYSSRKNQKFTLDNCIKYLNTFKNTKNLFLRITDKNKNFIGTCTVYIDKINQKANLGFWIANKQRRNEGYGSETLKLLKKYLFKKKNINKISCGTISLNKPMIEVCLKNNFKFEATLKKEKKIGNKFYDIKVYSIIK